MKIKIETGDIVTRRIQDKRLSVPSEKGRVLELGLKDSKHEMMKPSVKVKWPNATRWMLVENLVRIEKL